jgi:hypothetical protein
MNIFEFWNDPSEFPYFLWGNSLWYASALDCEHVSGTNYARKPRCRCINIKFYIVRKYFRVPQSEDHWWKPRYLKTLGPPRPVKGITIPFYVNSNYMLINNQHGVHARCNCHLQWNGTISVPFPLHICAASLYRAINHLWQHNNFPYATQFLPFGTESDLFIFSTF